jgi:hypothetical protein
MMIDRDRHGGAVPVCLSGLAALWLLASLLSIAPVTAQAAGLSAGISYNRYHTDFDFDHGPTTKADIDAITLTIGESITPLFDLAVQGGYNQATLDRHPADGGYNLTGRFYGIVARTEPTLIPKLLSLRIQAAYRWHDVDNGRLDGQYDELRWRDAELRAGPVLSIGPVHISAGGYFEHYDGDEKAHGPLQFRRDFGAKDNGGAFASVALELGSHGYIGLYGQSGVRRGFGINFSGGF